MSSRYKQFTVLSFILIGFVILVAQPRPALAQTPTDTVVVLNEGTEKSCAEICLAIDYECQSVGTDSNGTNKRFYYVEYFTGSSQCTLSGAGINCNEVMWTGDRACQGHNAEWTNCRCISYTATPKPTFSPSPTPVVSPSPTPSPGWPQKIPGTARSVVVSDLDRNDTEEVVVGGGDINGTYIAAFSPLGGKRWDWQGEGQQVSGAVAVGNIDGDAYPEIVFTAYLSVGERLYILEHDGTLKAQWPATSSGRYHLSDPVLADINKDGILEIVMGADETLVVLDGRTASLTPVWIRSLGERDAKVTTSAVADLDNDGKLEIISGAPNTNNWILSSLKISRSDGTEYLTVPLANELPGNPVLGDVDDDGDLEIIFSSWMNRPEKGKVYVLNHTGSLASGWPVETSLGLSNVTSALADIDYDGKLEIFINAKTAGYMGWYHNGTVVPGWPVIVPSKVSHSYAVPAVIGDTDGDLIANVFFEDSACNAWGYSAYGKLIPGFPKNFGENCQITEMALTQLAHITNLVVTTSTGEVHMLNFGLPYNQNLFPWTYFLRGIKRNGVYTQLPAPSVLPTPPPSLSPSPSPLSSATPLPQCQLTSDANCDNVANLLDFAIWVKHLDKDTINGNRDGDFNNSGKIDLDDFFSWIVTYMLSVSD